MFRNNYSGDRFLVTKLSKLPKLARLVKDAVVFAYQVVGNVEQHGTRA